VFPHRLVIPKNLSAIVTLIAVLAASSFGQASQCTGKRELKEDIERWSKVLEKNPNDVAAMIRRGIAYTSAGNILLARKDLDRAIELAPTSAKAFEARGTLEVTLVRLEPAVSDFSKAIQFDPNSGRSFYQRGRAYEMLNKLDLALNDLRMSIELLNDDGFAAYAVTGAIYIERKERDMGSLWLNQAIEILDQKIKMADAAKCNEYLYRVRGYTALEARRFNDAFRDLNEAVRQDPTSFDAHGYRASVYLQVGAVPQALADINRAIELMPIRADFYNFRARVREILNDKPGALIDRAKFQELSGAK